MALVAGCVTQQEDETSTPGGQATEAATATPTPADDTPTPTETATPTASPTASPTPAAQAGVYEYPGSHISPAFRFSYPTNWFVTPPAADPVQVVSITLTSWRPDDGQGTIPSGGSKIDIYVYPSGENPCPTEGGVATSVAGYPAVRTTEQSPSDSVSHGVAIGFDTEKAAFCIAGLFGTGVEGDPGLNEIVDSFRFTGATPTPPDTGSGVAAEREYVEYRQPDSEHTAAFRFGYPQGWHMGGGTVPEGGVGLSITLSSFTPAASGRGGLPADSTKVDIVVVPAGFASCDVNGGEQTTIAGQPARIAIHDAPFADPSLQGLTRTLQATFDYQEFTYCFSAGFSSDPPDMTPVERILDSFAFTAAPPDTGTGMARSLSPPR